MERNAQLLDLEDIIVSKEDINHDSKVVEAKTQSVDILLKNRCSENYGSKEKIRNNGERDKNRNYDGLKIYLKAARDIKRLNEEEQYKLFKKVRAGDKEAKNKIVESNLFLVVSIAKRNYFNNGVIEFSDLVQEGNKGLIKAVNRYDPYKINEKTGKSYKFSTYAVWWIKQTISRWLEENRQQILLPVYMTERKAKYNKIRNKVWQEEGYEPSREEIAKEMKMPLEKVEEIEKFTSIKVESLESAIYGEEGDEILLKDSIEDKNSVMPDRDFFINYGGKDLINLINNLPKISKNDERDKRIFILRYGLDNGSRWRTLQEVGYIAKLSRERIRQITNRVEGKFRKKYLKSVAFS